MNRSERRALKKLPRTRADWEVDLIRDSGVQVDEVELDGVLFVVDAATARPLGAGVISAGDTDEIVAVVAQAMLEPRDPEMPPGRPKSIRCRDPELLRILKSRLRSTGAAFVAVDELPAIEHVTAGFDEYMANGPPIPGITVFHQEYRQVLERLRAHRCTEALAPEMAIEFECESMNLDDPVLLVMRQDPEAEGFCILADWESFEGLIHLSELDPNEATEDQIMARMEGVDMWNLYIDRPGTLDEANKRRCEEAGLVLSDGATPRLVFTSDGLSMPAETDDQYAVLVMLEALAGYLDALRADDGLHRPRTVTVPSGNHRITVFVDETPDVPDSLPFLFLGDFKLSFARAGVAYPALPPNLQAGRTGPVVEVPVIRIQQRKADAVRTVRHLDEINGIGIADNIDDADHLLVVGLVDGIVAGIVAVVEDAADRKIVRALVDLARDLDGHALLQIAGGGPTRRYAEKNLIEQRWITLSD